MLQVSDPPGGFEDQDLKDLLEMYNVKDLDELLDGKGDLDKEFIAADHLGFFENPGNIDDLE